MVSMELDAAALKFRLIATQVGRPLLLLWMVLSVLTNRRWPELTALIVHFPSVGYNAESWILNDIRIQKDSDSEIFRPPQMCNAYSVLSILTAPSQCIYWHHNNNTDTQHTRGPIEYIFLSIAHRWWTVEGWQNADLVVGSQLPNVLSQQGSWHWRRAEKLQFAGNNGPKTLIYSPTSWSAPVPLSTTATARNSNICCSRVGFSPTTQTCSAYKHRSCVLQHLSEIEQKSMIKN